MFSSGQILEVSGRMGQLERTIQFVADMYSPSSLSRISYQKTDDGKYCLGWAGHEKGWEPLPFDFNAHIIAEIIKQHLEKQNCENPWKYGDGTSEKGFLMKVINNCALDENGIKNPQYGIVSFEVYYNYYGK